MDSREQLQAALKSAVSNAKILSAFDGKQTAKSIGRGIHWQTKANWSASQTLK
jgi:hypothetical protein